MNVTSAQIYWILMLDNFNSFSFVLSVVLLLVALCFLIVNISTSPNDYYATDESVKIIKQKSFKMFLIFLFSAIPFLLVITFLPTTKQMATILVLPKVINNEQVQQLPLNVVNLANEWIEELRPKSTVDDSTNHN